MLFLRTDPQTLQDSENDACLDQYYLWGTWLQNVINHLVFKETLKQYIFSGLQFGNSFLLNVQMSRYFSTVLYLTLGRKEFQFPTPRMPNNLCTFWNPRRQTRPRQQAILHTAVHCTYHCFHFYNFIDIYYNILQYFCGLRVNKCMNKRQKLK